jgi:hypothetical protein
LLHKGITNAPWCAGSGGYARIADNLRAVQFWP